MGKGCYNRQALLDVAWEHSLVNPSKFNRKPAQPGVATKLPSALGVRQSVVIGVGF
jgi:hypothetical protein